MRAYAILDGGGVKGAALAGCLQAAKELNIEFAGYGGTSAGSIIAFLASIGFTGRELERIMVNQVEFTNFLDDSGDALQRLKRVSKELSNARYKLSWFWTLMENRDLAKRLIADLGLYEGNKIKEFLLEKAREKFTYFDHQDDVTFDDLNRLNCPPLKIVVSNLGYHVPNVYSGSGGSKEINGSVIDAVRASISYPFVFRPVRVHSNYLVDGGLSINLPIFLFNKERKSDGLPVIAFDLVANKGRREGQYGIGQFCGDMLTTALESSEHLLRLADEGVYHVYISVPEDIDTLDFSLSTQRRKELFMVGHSATHEYFSKNIPQWTQATNRVEQLQARYAPTRWIVPLLETIAKKFEEHTPAKNVRTNIMLPTGYGTHIVAYQYGMDNDPDIDLEISINAGCSGTAWVKRQPTFADMAVARTAYSQWHMKKEQQNKVRSDRRAVLSVPIFDVGRSAQRAQNVDQLDILGVLSIDTSTSLDDTEWREGKFAVQTAKRWADILSRVLT